MRVIVTQRVRGVPSVKTMNVYQMMGNAVPARYAAVMFAVLQARSVATAPVAIARIAAKVTPHVVMIVAMTFAVVQPRLAVMASAVITTVESAVVAKNAVIGQ